MRVGLGGGEAEVVAGGADDIPFNFFQPVLHLPWMRACSRGHGRRGGAEGGGGQGHAHRRAAAGGRLQPAGSTPKKATRPSSPVPEEQAAVEAAGEAAPASTPEGASGGRGQREAPRVEQRRRRTTSRVRSPTSSRGR